jgi:hypothetical protein
MLAAVGNSDAIMFLRFCEFIIVFLNNAKATIPVRREICNREKYYKTAAE